ncbi:unnamed protein product [Cylicocyclus nassatus]|uniref:Uncharacterized protein n=1 Tax=Cylicocyclus nassatus TaxID=53992 RepID=A0AA36GKN5_CYLNA|nr:unnamed protein product [Cylicocyclus nassatus]
MLESRQYEEHGVDHTLSDLTGSDLSCGVVSQDRFVNVGLDGSACVHLFFKKENWDYRSRAELDNTPNASPTRDLN